MNRDLLKDLKDSGSITDAQYQIYLIFEESDLGREFFHNMSEAIFMEEPLNLSSDNVMWHDGRRSVYRDFKMVIQRIKIMLREKHDRDSRNRSSARNTNEF